MTETIRLFVGTSANGDDYEAEAVLEHSARGHCSLPLDIVWMRQGVKPWKGWACETGRTPFTHFRWSIPSVCNYEGRAIYTDVDFLFCADLAELWRQDIPGVGLVRNPTGKVSTSCILFDCAKAKGHVPPVETLKRLPDAHGAVLNYFRAHTHLLAATEGNWDCGDLRGYDLDDPLVKAVHYTRIETQLHLKHAAPRLAALGRSHWYTGETFPHSRPELQAVFDQLLVAAVAAGYTEDRYGYQDVAIARKDFTYKQRRTA